MRDRQSIVPVAASNAATPAAVICGAEWQVQNPRRPSASAQIAASTFQTIGFWPASIWSTAISASRRS